jgi:hypothetical protein
MASINNVFLLAGTPFKQYTKTVPSKIAGTRLDPMANEMRPIEFVLDSSPDGFDPDIEVLAVYTEKEELYVMQANRALFSLGMLKEYSGEAEVEKTIDYTNFMTDEEVRAIAVIRSVNTLREKLSTVSSYFTVTRILRAAEEAGVKKANQDVIRARQAELAP